MPKYKYNFFNVKQGQLFKDFTALFETITGEKPPTGARNRAAIKRELSRHISYCKASEINPEVTSKRAIIVKEIYNTPLKLKENRGKHGKYSDHLKPLLLLSCGYASFEGKMCRLSNSLGIFEKYTLDKLNNTEVWDSKSKKDRLEFNPWEIKEDMMPGKQQYLRKLWNQIRTAIERSLKSLQEDGIVEWTYYHKLKPDVLTDIAGRKERRLKSSAELQEDNNRREKLLEEISSDANSVLRPETLEQLNIYSKSWDNCIDRDILEKAVYINDMSIPDEFLIRATKKQEAAIANLEQFMRQYTYKRCYKLKSLPSVKEISNEFEFFQNSYLARIYKQMVKEMYPWLIECKVMWKEVEYRVVGDSHQLEYYINSPEFDSEAAKESLSKEFLRYMNTHMQDTVFLPTSNTMSDIKEKRFGKSTGPLMEKPIAMSIAACKLHEKLRQFYEI